MSVSKWIYALSLMLSAIFIAVRAPDATASVPTTPPTSPTTPTTANPPTTGDANTTGNVPTTGEAPTAGNVNTTGEVNTTGNVPTAGEANTTGNVPTTSEANTTGNVPTTGEANSTGNVPTTGEANSTGNVPTTGEANTTGNVPTTGEANTTGNVPTTGEANTTGNVPTTGEANSTGNVPTTGEAPTTGITATPEASPTAGNPPTTGIIFSTGHTATPEASPTTGNSLTTGIIPSTGHTATPEASPTTANAPTTTTTAYDPTGGCDTSDQWQPFNNSCYRRLKLNPPKGWRDANSKCADVGGHLAVVRTKAENEFIKDHLLPDADPNWKYHHSFAMWMGLYLQWATCDGCINVQSAKWADDTPLGESELLPYPITLLAEKSGKYPWETVAAAETTIMGNTAQPGRCGHSDCCTVYYSVEGYSIGDWGVFGCDDIMLWALCQKKPASQ